MEQRGGVADVAIGAILKMVSSARLSAGDRLPPEKELAAQLGLSRNSLREAVRALTILRVLEPRQGDGTYVTSLQPHLLTEAVALVTDLLSERAVAELYQVRRILEAEASAMASIRISPADLARLGQLADDLSAATDPEQFIDIDQAFHDLVAVASGNQVLASLLRSLSSRTMRARRWRALAEAGSLPRTVEQHRAIHDAIVRGDPEVARAAAAIHVAEGENWLREHIDEPGLEIGAG